METMQTPGPNFQEILEISLKPTAKTMKNPKTTKFLATASARSPGHFPIVLLV